MSKKRLFVTGSTFPRWKGDTEPRFVLDLCKALTPYYDVTALMPMAPGAKEEEVLEGVKVKRFHYFPIHKWETLCYPGAIVPRIKQKKIRALLVPFLMLSLYHNLNKYKKDYDFVHAHWFIPQGIVQSFVKKPFIVTGHGGDVTSLNSGLFKKLKKRVLKKAKGITFVSQQLEDYLYDFFPEDRENFKK
ncbi:glycosyltransferase, partial [uncultured Dubosiella sp.]